MSRWNKKNDRNLLLQQEEGKFAKIYNLLNSLKRYRRIAFNVCFVLFEILLLVLICIYSAARFNNSGLLIAIAFSALIGTQAAWYNWTMYRVRKAIVKANNECTHADLSDQIELLLPLEEYHDMFSLQAKEIGNTQKTEDSSTVISKAAEEVIIRYNAPSVAVKFSSQNLHHYTFMTRIVPFLHSSNLLSAPSRFADSIKFSAEKFNYSSIKEFFEQDNSKLSSDPIANKGEQNDPSDTKSMINSSRCWRIYHFHSKMNVHLSHLAVLSLVLLVGCSIINAGFESMYSSLSNAIYFACAVCLMFSLFLLLINGLLKAFTPMSRISKILMKYALTGKVSMLGTILEQLKNHRGYLNSSFFDDIRSSTIMLMAQVKDETSTNLTQVQRRILEQMLVNDKYVGSISYPRMSYFTMVTSNGPLKLSHYAAHALGYLGDKSSLAELKKIVKRTKDVALQQIASDAIVRLNHKIEVGDSYLLRSSQISNSSRDLLNISLPHDDLDEEKQTLNNRSIE